MVDAQNEINEKCYLIKNDILVKNLITPKVAAEFAAIYYKIYRENYDEKTFVSIVKELMEFFNSSVKNLPKKNLVLETKDLLDDIEILKGNVQKYSKVFIKPESGIFQQSFSSNMDLKSYEDRLKDVKKDLKILELNKPFFKFFWRRKIKKELFKLDSIEKSILNIYDTSYEENLKKSEEFEELFLDIKKDLKKFMQEIKPTIGEELADIPYQSVVQNLEALKSFIFDVVIKNCYEYYMLTENKL